MKSKQLHYFYIYNLEQSLFFIQEGLVPVKIDMAYKTKKVFHQFVRDENAERIFEKWLVKIGKK